MRSFRRLLGRFAFQQFADRVFDDVVDDISGRVVDAAGFADFGLLFNSDAPFRRPRCGLDDFAQEAFVDLPEDIGGMTENLIGALG